MASFLKRNVPRVLSILFLILAVSGGVGGVSERECSAQLDPLADGDVDSPESEPDPEEEDLPGEPSSDLASPELESSEAVPEDEPEPELESDTAETAQTVGIPTENPQDLSLKECGLLLEQATGWVREARWEEAVSALHALKKSRYRTKWEKNIDLLLGYTLTRVGRDEEAVQLLPGTVRAFGALFNDIHFWLAEAYFRLEKWEIARGHYLKVIKEPAGLDELGKARHKEKYYYFRSRLRELECLLRMEKLGSVIHRSRLGEQEFGDLSEDHPKFCSDDFSWLRSQAYRLRGREDLEQKILQRIDLLRPGCFYGGEMYSRIGELKASGSFKPPLEGNELIAYLARLRRDWANREILDVVEKARRKADAGSVIMDPVIRAKLDHFKGRALLNEQQYEAALETFWDLYKRKDSIESRKDDYLFMTAKTLARMNKLEEASRTYRKLADHYPKSSLAKTSRLMAGWIIGYENGQMDLADELLEIYGETYPNRSDVSKALWFRGWFAYTADNWVKAQLHFQELLQRYPRSHYKRQCHYWIGRIYQRMGRLKEAEKEFRALAEEDTFNYYRLLSVQQLDRMHARESPKEESTLQPAGVSGENPETGSVPPASSTDPASDEKVADAAVQVREASVPVVDVPTRTPESERKKEAGEFTLERLRQGMDAAAEEMKAYYTKGSWSRRKRLGTLAGEIREWFPDLRRAVALDRLGLEKEAAQAFTALFQELIALQKRPREGKYRDESEEQYKLRRAKQEIVSKFYDRFHRDLLAIFVTYGDFSMAHRVYSLGLPRNQRWSQPERFRKFLMYPMAHREAIKTNAAGSGSPDDLTVSIIRTESRFKPHAVSYMNALGLMQVMPHTGTKIAERLGETPLDVSGLFRSEVGIRYGSWYLGQLLEKFKGQLPLAIAAYNGGPHNVVTWLERHPGMEWDEFIECIEFVQTRNYVKKVLRTMAAYRFLYTGVFEVWDFSKPIEYGYRDNIDF